MPETGFNMPKENKIFITEELRKKTESNRLLRRRRIEEILDFSTLSEIKEDDVVVIRGREEANLGIVKKINNKIAEVELDSHNTELVQKEELILLKDYKDAEKRVAEEIPYTEEELEQGYEKRVRPILEKELEEDDRILH